MRKRLRPKSWVKVNTRQRDWPLEDGNVDRAKPVTLYLDPTGTATFCFDVPDYVQEALQVEHVSEATAELAERAWRELVERFSQHVKSAKAEPVIIVKIDTESRNAHYNDAGLGEGRHATNRKVSLRYTLAFRVHDNYFSRTITEVRTNPHAKWEEGTDYWARHPVESVGARLRFPDGKVLDYTPELHRRLDAIADALDIAVTALQELSSTDDLAAALMALTAGPLLLAKPKKPVKA